MTHLPRSAGPPHPKRRPRKIRRTQKTPEKLKLAVLIANANG